MSLNYVTLGSNDVPKARAFFDAVLPVIGGQMIAEYMPHAFCYGLRGGGRIWVLSPFNGETATVGNGNMVGLLCESEAEVDAAHKAALDHGAVDEGKPGPRPLYGPDFYGAYVRDLDGNKISFVIFGEASAS
ncbi:MAG: VOC family protein [Pseudomonadota bacterium]